MRTVWHLTACHLVVVLSVFVQAPVLADDSTAKTAPAELPVRGEAPVKVRVFYLTNRRHHEENTAADRYGGDRGESRFGRCEVEFTPIPIINHVATKIPFYIKRETSAVLHTEQLEPVLFLSELGAAVKRTSSRSVVLYVHGYNYGFERSCRMGAEMQRSLQDKATVVVFSWPSNGLPTDCPSYLCCLS